ncbi:MAG: DUF1476 domain-containing protein [Alphaproteobacteria bacterium]|nr:DUF1476 domain-containing protein [Alphaproteobacteria bacterium]
MSGMDDRKKGFEGTYAHREKMDFAIEARTSKLFGLWAAERLGLSGPDASTYAADVVSSNLEEPGFQDVLRKVRADFDAKEIDVTDHLMEVELDKALEEAKKQLKGAEE